MSGGRPQDVLDDLKPVFEDKNDDYGNSWEKVGVIKRIMADEEGPRTVTVAEGETVHLAEEFGDDVDEFEVVVLADTPDNTSTFEQNADDLFTRLLDKLIRAYNLTLMKDEPALDNESTEDAAKDLTGYSSMLTSLIRRAD